MTMSEKMSEISQNVGQRKEKARQDGIILRYEPNKPIMSQ